MPDLTSNARLGFGIAVGFFVFALVLVVFQMILGKVKG